MHSINLPRTCLGCTNALFFFLGMTGGLVCIWCAVNTEFFKDVNYTITRSSIVAAIANFVNLKLWLTPLTTFLIPLAVLTILTSCCGIFGAGCQIKCALKSYMILVSVLLCTFTWMFFISGVYKIYSNSNDMRKFMVLSIKRDYGKQEDLVTFVWNYVMVEYECCGAVSADDFVLSEWQLANQHKLYPDECCKLYNKTTVVPISANCTKTFRPEAEYHTMTCFTALRNTILQNKTKLICYFVIAVCFYVILVFFTYVIVRGEPLLGPMAGRMNLMPFGTPRQPPAQASPSGSSLQNMLFVDEAPKRVVKVVSAVNPAQRYTFSHAHAHR